MSDYRRMWVAGGTYFLTLVTHQRRRFLCEGLARRHLCEAIRKTRNRRPFEIVAFVLVPDHLHMIWRLPHNDNDYALRIGALKKIFTLSYRSTGGVEGMPSQSRLSRRIGGFWQKRFYEHTIRDERDFIRHIEYVHVNPVKHGLTKAPRDWPWSSFHRYVEDMEYPVDWLAPKDPIDMKWDQ